MHQSLHSAAAGLVLIAAVVWFATVMPCLDLFVGAGKEG